MIDASGTYAYFYDGFGRLTGEDKTLGGNLYATRYGYDPAGRPASLTYPSGRVVAYERNEAGLLSRVTTTKGDETRMLAENITHLPFGPVSSLSYGNGLSLSMSFDRMYRLTGSQLEDLQNLTYTRE